MLTEKQKKWILTRSGKNLTVGLLKLYLQDKIEKSVLLESLQYWLDRKDDKDAKTYGSDGLLNLVGEIFDKDKKKENNSDFTINHPIFLGKTSPQAVGIADFRLEKDNFIFNIKGYPNRYKIPSKKWAEKYPRDNKNSHLIIFPLKDLEVV